MLNFKKTADSTVFVPAMVHRNSLARFSGQTPGWYSVENGVFVF